MVGRLAWRCFIELDAARQYTMVGPQPISFREIQAWCDLTGERLRPWEVRAVHKIDIHRRAALQSRSPDEPQVSDRPMSPALFDALF